MSIQKKINQRKRSTEAVDQVSSQNKVLESMKLDLIAEYDTLHRSVHNKAITGVQFDSLMELEPSDIEKSIGILRGASEIKDYLK